MKILVLDMSPMARRIIRDELLASSYEILEADTPDAAMEILATVPDISLVTTALSLGEIDGFDFLENLRSQEVINKLKPMNNHQVPAIFVTANDTDADRLKGFKVGAADFIQKPWTRGKLTEQVEAALGQSDELHGMQVLVVDDSPTARVFIQVCLQRLGVTIHMADDGTSALEFLKNNQVDLVLTDLNMVQMNGDELCLKIREDLGLKELPVIFLSANDDRNTIITLFRMGATDYLNKPFLQEELMARIRAHLHREKLLLALRDVADIRSSTADQKHFGGASNSSLSVLEQGAKRPPRILLVDDGPVNLAVGSKVLQRMGCQVEAVADGDLALEFFISRLDTEPFDLILMDLMMPKVSGTDATRKIREIEKGLAASHPQKDQPVPIIALSASDPNQAQTECLAAGMNGFQEKPFHSDAVREVVEHFLPVAEPV